MVHYLYKKEDRKAYPRGFVLLACRRFIIIVLIFALITVSAFLGEFSEDEQYLKLLCACVGIIGILLSTGALIVSIRNIVKHFENLFQYADENGNVSGTIYVKNDEIVVEETSKNFTHRIGIEYIKGIGFCGNCLIIYCPAEPIYLPKTDELIAFLEPYKKR
mgnify:CR=1 FL=1